MYILSVRFCSLFVILRDMARILFFFFGLDGILTNEIFFFLSSRLFVNIGKGLISGGPASLFIAYTLW